jgi:RNA polymerase sigma factor (sigma-70 family)
MLHSAFAEHTDSDLWLLLKQGEIKALETLHARHYKVLYRFGLKLCANKEITSDCLQDLFFQLWNKRSDLKDVKSVRFYLIKWLKRDIIRAISGKNSGANFTDLSVESEKAFEVSVDDVYEKLEADKNKRAILEKAMETLSPREREVIYLRFFMEMTYDEICNALQLSYQVVMNYIHRALKTLRANKLISKLAPIIALVLSYFGFKLIFFDFFG